MVRKWVTDDDVIDHLDSGKPPSSPEEAAARAPYERLLALLGNLDEISPPPGWEERAMARWWTARRARRVRIALWVIAAVTVTTVIVIVSTR